MAKRNGLAGLTLKELRREMARRQRRVPVLRRRRDRVLAKVAALDAQIAELGGNARASLRTASGRRFRNELGLNDALVAALKGKTLSVTDAAEAVQKAGYRTASKHFRTQVNIALIKDKRFKRVERGQYTVK